MIFSIKFSCSNTAKCVAFLTKVMLVGILSHPFNKKYILTMWMNWQIKNRDFEAFVLKCNIKLGIIHIHTLSFSFITNQLEYILCEITWRITSIEYCFSHLIAATYY